MCVCAHMCSRMSYVNNWMRTYAFYLNVSVCFKCFEFQYTCVKLRILFWVVDSKNLMIYGMNQYSFCSFSYTPFICPLLWSFCPPPPSHPPPPSSLRRPRYGRKLTYVTQLVRMNGQKTKPLPFIATIWTTTDCCPQSSFVSASSIHCLGLSHQLSLPKLSALLASLKNQYLSWAVLRHKEITTIAIKEERLIRKPTSLSTPLATFNRHFQKEDNLI